jgi:CubicO group peptidase (beta-lactamase class C family)
MKRFSLTPELLRVAKSDPDNIISFVRGYGKTSGSDPTAENVTADTAFMLASVSKVFTGSAVATLLEQGFISSLDDDICDALPDTWKTGNNMAACRNPHFPETIITWRMLVTHRSSLMRDVPSVTIEGELVLANYGPANFAYFSGPAYGNPTCPIDDNNFYRAMLTPGSVTTMVGGGDIDWYNVTLVATDGVGAWSNSTPGSAWEYSNFAFAYLAPLIEFKTNQSFASYCNDVLFDKLEMSNTAWFREDLPPTTLQAHPQSPTGEDVGFYCFADYASGQLYSTANDLAKFASSMLTKGVADKLWSDDVGNSMFTCQEQDELGNAVSTSECSNGISWFVLDNSKKESNDTEYQALHPFAKYDWTGGATHAGDEYGVATRIVVLPAANVYLVVLNNIAFVDKTGPTLILDAIATAQVAMSPLEPVATSPAMPAVVTGPATTPATVPSVPTGSSTASSSAPLVRKATTAWFLASVFTFLIVSHSIY